jgi:hypothetical protein
MASEITKYLDGALTVLKKLNIIPEKESQLVGILDEVVSVDEAKVIAVANTIKYMGSFNELVRDKVSEVKVADRYAKINDMFTSIRDDSKNLIRQLEDGKIDTKEKLENFWMNLTRGSTHDRFEKIKDIYGDVSVDAKKQIDTEKEILSAYMDFRFALKGTEIIAYELLNTQTANLEKSKTEFGKLTSDVEAYKGEDLSEKSKLQLKRDEAKREFEKQDRFYQLFKDVAENISNSYNVGEAVAAKLKQTTDLKDQVYRSSVAFFTTNESVLTMLDATYTAQRGLHEETQTLETLKDGMNKSLEDIADFGGKIEENALKAAYGSKYNVSSVQKLVDAITSYQENSVKLIEQYRTESTQNTKDITQIVDAGKKKVSDITTRYALAGTSA